ncbi:MULTISPECIES: hypothetical protein [Streptomyces]|uniref:hypothetical protein n=1 Tax=Streptomyces TaxID=1883 RepID=UPI000F550F50|nr:MULTISPECIES: hypothetical protein [Streptomyces]RPK33449.1 hypothetical protein EES37_30980 [Streptomyces sp. ADI91-18]WBY23403.1 hypothetical protein PET44_29370 [Streptomyces goshikiensis]
MTPHSDEALYAKVSSAGPGAFWALGGPEGLQARSAAGTVAAHTDADAVHDVAGLAPVLALWPVIGCLVDRGELSLHTPLTAHGPTTHQLLTRGAADGLPGLVPFVEGLCGAPLADCAAELVWRPLGMTRTGPGPDGTLRAPLADLGRFLGHLLSPADHPVPRAWTAESLRIRTGELTPARGLLWHPGPYGVWSYGDGPSLFVWPRHSRWAALVPGPGDAGSAALRTAFREAVFAGDAAEAAAVVRS